MIETNINQNKEGLWMKTLSSKWFTLIEYIYSMGRTIFNSVLLILHEIAMSVWNEPPQALASMSMHTKLNVWAIIKQTTFPHLAEPLWNW